MNLRQLQLEIRNRIEFRFPNVVVHCAGGEQFEILNVSDADYARLRQFKHLIRRWAEGRGYDDLVFHVLGPEQTAEHRWEIYKKGMRRRRHSARVELYLNQQNIGDA